ncbi:MAG: DEAD/DEAH box helicase [bacterium]|nr:DEAD/DEAH box helicase [bacterium]
MLNVAISAAGYTEPTPIQSKAIPEVMAGKDILGLAQTGTGKTAAFVLPILEKLYKSKKRGVSALILAPTRELAEQIKDSIYELSRGSNVRVTSIYGGMKMFGQIRALRDGANIVVACPGRLLDHIENRTIDLKNIDTLVLDEADQMFDMGFLPGIRQILKQLPKERQSLLFSATMPFEIKKLAMDILKNPVTVEVNRSAPAETVAHSIYPVRQNLKMPLLLKILDHASSGSVLVFCRTKHRAKRVSDQLIKENHAATCLQGNLSQGRRKEALDGFRSEKYRIMVATDIAARGIDVSSITHVINFDIPDTVEAYTHRIGRTGRAARTGDAFTLVAPEDESMVRTIERVIRKTIERKTIEGFDYNSKEVDSKMPTSNRFRGNGRRESRPPNRNGGFSRQGRQGGNRTYGNRNESFAAAPERSPERREDSYTSAPRRDDSYSGSSSGSVRREDSYSGAAKGNSYAGSNSSSRPARRPGSSSGSYRKEGSSSGAPRKGGFSSGSSRRDTSRRDF